MKSSFPRFSQSGKSRPGENKTLFVRNPLCVFFSPYNSHTQAAHKQWLHKAVVRYVFILWMLWPSHQIFCVLVIRACRGKYVVWMGNPGLHRNMGWPLTRVYASTPCGPLKKKKSIVHNRGVSSMPFEMRHQMMITSRACIGFVAFVDYLT